MSINRFTVDFSSVVDPGSVCTSPTITYINPQNLSVPCTNENSLDIEINTDVAGPYCLTFIVDCSANCSSCGQIEVTKCFCIDPDDCGDCENCTGNVCVSSCAAGKICDNDTCVDCTLDSECLCNQGCQQGQCRCDGGLKKRADGCCVECFDDDDLGNCLICIAGTIVAVDCNGHCNPSTGECQECYNNDHCLNPNECCNEFGICECCPGHILDPDTNQCVPAPPCFNAQDCIDQYGPCYYCTPDGCAPIVCPNGGVCDSSTGECVPPCGNCPDGSGCINGLCIPCSQLSCVGEGLLCQYAVGCECNGTVCEYINCNVDTVDLQWNVSTGTPGTVVDPGQPALAGTTLITPTGLITLQPPSGASYQNHQFNLSVTNGTNGTWTLYHTPTDSVGLGSGTSVLFDLAGTTTSNGPNLVGFVVKFVETGSGRTATWGFYRTPTAPITAADVWNYEFHSTGTNATTTGGTPGAVQLCSTNGNFSPTGVTNVVTTGDINITFIPDGNQCLTAYITGCGTWNGDVVLSCGGTTVTVPAPEFTRDPANCCDPTDPSCDGWGTGEPCGDITVQNITLVALPTYGLSGSGDGEFLVIADWTTAGLSFLDLFYLNPSDACWSVNNPSGGDAQIVTNNAQSPFGPSVSNLSVLATIGDGGCVRLGHTCELKIAGCKKLQGEICLTECQAFTVDIVQTGTNTYMAAPSMQDETVTFQWTYPGLVNNTGQTVTIVPQGGVTTLIVTARYSTKCVASDSITFNTVMPGCTNRSACNYDSTATTDDGTCVLIGSPSYNCALGGFQPGTIDATSINTPTILWKIGGVTVNTNSPLNPGTYTVDLFFNGIQKCSRSLVVPQCYRCSAGTCIPSPSGDNIGGYTTINCDNKCSCDIEVNVTQNCSNNRGALVITATGDTGTYTATVNRVGGSQVLAPTVFNTAGSVTTPLLCNGVYRVLVEGATCNKSVDYSVTCFQCSGSTSALSSISYDCPTNQLFATITADACASGYTIRLIDSLGNIDGTQSFTTAGAKTIPLGVYPGDDNYNVQLVDSNGCVRNYDLDINCNGTLADCPITSSSLSYVDTGTFVSFTSSFVLDTAGGNYSVTLYTTTGGSPTCAGASVDTIITSTNVIGTAGNNVVNFPNAISTPGIRTCYAVVVQNTSVSTCNDTAFVSVDPSVAAPPCSITITNVSYDTVSGNVLVSWEGAETSNDLTVEIQAISGGVCNVGDPIVVTSTGNGEDGLNIPFGPITQIQGTAQCITVTIYDSNEPTCQDSMQSSIAACSCEIVIDNDSVVIDSAAETVEFDFTTKCTSGDATIFISGDATGSQLVPTADEDNIVTTHTAIVALSGYPSVGGNILIEVIDDVNGACNDTLSVPLPQNCVACGQVASIYLEGSVVTEVRNQAGVLIASGSLTATAAGEAAFETAVENGVTTDGGNFCLTGEKVEVEYPRESGIRVRQDSSDYVALNYVEVTDPDFVGNLKSYFGDCGCSIGRLCNYTYVIPIGASTTLFSINFADNNSSSGFTSQYASAIDQTPSGSELTLIGTDLKAALEAAACGYTVGTVVATYGGANELTIVISGTNAGLGIAFTTGGTASFVEATQSGCV